MLTAGIRHLRNNLSRYLRRLKPGEVIMVTDRGRVIAELRSASGTSPAATPLTGGYERLLADGVIAPAREAGDPLADLNRHVKSAPPGTVETLIREDRGD